MSFGFKHGPPREEDLAFDVRFLPNPHYVPELRELTGLDEAVVDYIARDGRLEEFYERLNALLDFLLPQYVAEGKAHLVIAVGCTGGRHRSVAIAEHLAERYRDQRGSARWRWPTATSTSVPWTSKEGEPMIDHVGVEVVDLARSAAFYDAVFFAIGVRRMHESPARRSPTASTCRASGSSPAAASPAPGYGHLAFTRRRSGGGRRRPRRRPSNGGRDDGEPGPRTQYGPRYYAAYLLDPDGLRVEIVDRLALVPESPEAARTWPAPARR